MTELMSQAYALKQNQFQTPPWMKIKIRNINNPFDILKDNKTGGLNIIDLANYNTCSFIQTDDIGRQNNNIFEILGRYDNSMSRYLRATGRSELAELADAISNHLIGDNEVYSNPKKYFEQLIEINLSELEPYLNGRFPPDRATPISKMHKEAIKNNWPKEVKVGLIGSCTN